MFTGIIEARLQPHDIVKSPEGLDFWLKLGPLATGVALGDSIAVDGCCLTVAAQSDDAVQFHAGRETLGLTNLARLSEQSALNIERALRLGDKMGGHMVSGHIDGGAEVIAIESEESQTVFRFRLDETLAKDVLLKGSIAIDGISLTLIAAEGREVAVAVIPHTLAVTNLGDRQVGDRCNIETDMMGKWVRNQVAAALEQHVADATDQRSEDPS